MVYFGRLHPKKGLRELVRACALHKQMWPDLTEKWQLSVVGWEQSGFGNEIRQLAASLDVEVLFPGPVFGEDKVALLTSADAFILPSFSEGLPMTVLEAWSYSLPVFMTRACNLPDGFDCGGAIEISTNPQEIAAVLWKFLQRDSLEEIGQLGYQLVRQKYSWDQASSSLNQVYQWATGDKRHPIVLQ